MERKPFSPETLMRVRRLRKARRLFKQAPLFAYQFMLADNIGYEYDDFLDDLRRRTPRKPKTKKSNLAKYGRFHRMEKLIFEYNFTKDVNLLIQAQRLRDHMTHPYKVKFAVKAENIICTFPAILAIERIEKLISNSKDCKTMEEVEKLVTDFRKSFGTIPD